MIFRNSRLACVTLAALATFAASACHSTPPGKPVPITYNDTQTLPTDALKARALAQLGAILTPAPPPPRSRQFNAPDRFDTVWLATLPRFDASGMCRYDLLGVGMRPDVEDVEQDAHTPTHAVSVDTTAWFSPVPAGTKACDGHDPATHHYFETDQPLQAELDFAMLKDVLARMDTSAPGFELTCDSTGCAALTCDSAECAALKAKANANTLWDISACRTEVANTDCRQFSWREPEYIELYITFDTPKLDRRILNVQLESGVVL